MSYVLCALQKLLLNGRYRHICVSPVLSAPKPKGKKAVDANKKTSETIVADENEHLFNIYADIPEDHTILSDDAYPKWLWDLDKADKSYGELMQMFVYGKDIESAQMKDYNRFLRLHNRSLIKLNNLRLQKRRKLVIKPCYWDV